MTPCMMTPWFTKRVRSLETFSCPERLGILGLEPPELRRLRCYLIQYYKIFDNLTSLNSVTIPLFINHLSLPVLRG